jgi:hypothetical protein
MRTRALRDRQWTRSINTLWQAKIPDLPRLKERLPGAVLVAFDSEGCSFDCDGHASTNKISELGFTALCSNIESSKLGYTGKEFSDDNDVQQLTIQLQEKTKVERTAGRIVHAQPAEVEKLVRDFLSNLPGRCILVGYDLSRELRWISTTFPSLADLFIAWIDVQEMLYHRCLESSPIFRVYEQLGLSTALRTMDFSAPSRSATTRAVNDCCRLLQVLAGLVQSVPFSLPGPRGPRIPRFSMYPRLPKPDKEKSPFALRITPSNGQRLPPRSPREVANVFHKYEGLRAVGLNWQSERVRREGVRFWWLSFSTQEALKDFYRGLHGGVFEDITLCAILDFPFEDGEDLGGLCRSMDELDVRETRQEQEVA